MKTPLVPSALSFLEARPHAKRKRRLGCPVTEVERLRLGRHPFAAAIKFYLERRYGTIAESTYKEEERKLRYLAEIFEQLKVEADTKDAEASDRIKGREEARPFTTDPRHIGRREIQDFMAWMRRQGLDPNTQAKYMAHIKSFLKVFKNHVIQDLEADGVRFPKGNKKPIRVLAVDDLHSIFGTLEGMDGWRSSIARGMIALAFATGTRPKEFRLAHLEDLNLKKMTFFVRHPKGEGSWASATEIDIIRPDMVPFLERYLRERSAHLKEQGIARSVPLFPNLYRGQDEFYSANAFYTIKHEVELASGVDFKLKDFRSTLTSITVNSDMSLLPAMSAQLRHKTVGQTQKSYYRMEQGAAGRQLKNACGLSGPPGP